MKTENKTVNKRLDSLLPELIQSYDYKLRMLEGIAKDGFTPENYQTLKQKTLLSLSVGKTKSSTRRKRRV